MALDDRARRIAEEVADVHVSDLHRELCAEICDLRNRVVELEKFVSDRYSHSQEKASVPRPRIGRPKQEGTA